MDPQGRRCAIGWCVTDAVEDAYDSPQSTALFAGPLEDLAHGLQDAHDMADDPAGVLGNLLALARRFKLDVPEGGFRPEVSK